MVNPSIKSDRNGSNQLYFGLVNRYRSDTFHLEGDRVFQGTAPFFDNVVIGNTGLSNAIEDTSVSPGVISSNWMMVKKKLSGDKIKEGDYEIDFVQSKIAGDQPYADSPDSHVHVFKTLGLYDTIVIRPKGKEKVRDTNVRNSVTSQISIDDALGLDGEIGMPELSGFNYIGVNKYENNKLNDSDINNDYFAGCRRIAEDILKNAGDLEKCLIYAPIRGAKPITDMVLEFLSMGGGQMPGVVYPVTSSFVRYPKSTGISSKKGKVPASGRFSNVLHLRKLRNELGNFNKLIYIDELISGGMMMGHTREMVGEPRFHPGSDSNPDNLDHGILRDLISDGDLSLHVYGLADHHGNKLRNVNRSNMELFDSNGLIRFKFFPIGRLITEDHRYFLGQHYLNYGNGPQSVPVIINGDMPDQKKGFEADFAKLVGDIK